MPVFDTPITTNDQSIDRILGLELPVLLYLYDTEHPVFHETLMQEASNHQGQILLVKVDAASSPATYSKYGQPGLPAALAIREGEVIASAQHIQSADVFKAHIDYLLGIGPKPESRQKSTTQQTRLVAVTDSTFQRDVLQSKMPVLVDFWAPWCGPCHMIAPTVEKIARQYAGRIKVAKLNIDENPATASQFQTMSIPTLILFNNGQPVDRLVGVQPASVIERSLEAIL